MRYTHCYACSFHSQVSTCESEITHVNTRRKTNRGDLWGAIAMAAFKAAFEKAHGCSSSKAPRLEADPMVTTTQVQRVLENFCNLLDGFVQTLFCPFVCSNVQFSANIIIRNAYPEVNMNRPQTCGVCCVLLLAPHKSTPGKLRRMPLGCLKWQVCSMTCWSWLQIQNCCHRGCTHPLGITNNIRW